MEEERANIVEQIKSLVSMRAAKEGRLGGFSYFKKKGGFSLISISDTVTLKNRARTKTSDIGAK